ncbi:MAG TPA: glycosyltransferase family 4 protein [Steroidobacteraceae bacterium]|jgi:glycosyltransferase involved in cell wall biosynthesis
MTQKLRHLLLATLEDPYNPRSWSGTPFNMRVALEGKIEKVSVLANLKPKRTLVTAALRALLGGKPARYPLFLTAPAQKEFARRTSQAISELKPDALLTISSHCVVRMAAPAVPAFMVTDAPWLSWKETYREFDRMPLLGPRFARLEAAASRRYTGLIFSSDWGVAEAQRLYGAPKEKLHSIPLGAIWTPDVSADELHSIIDARPTDRLDLLYVGKDWERKGGPLALEIARDLRDGGVPNVTLHIVGCTPEIAPADRNLVQLHGFLNVQIAEESSRLKHLFLYSHFLVVPTRAECFGVVFAEAQAFGLPPVSRSVQAVPSIVIDGVTGILEAADAPASSYGKRMLALIRDRDRYRTVARAARRQFETKLTWERFATGVVEMINRTMV